MRFIKEKLEKGISLFRTKSCKKIKKGDFNYYLGIAIATVVIIVIAWPQIKGIASTIFTTITAWFNTNTSKIFTNLP